ncbi:MAG: hypothetical protein LUF82_00005 [Clostridia bacterium]|nr:hypothetical protein [Clostridia bacterium]
MLQTAKSWLIKLLMVICIVCCSVALCFGISACTGADGADGEDGVGVSAMSYSNGTLTITLTDGTTKSVDISSAAEDGVSVTDAYVSETDGHLYIVLSNSTTAVDCGSVLGSDGVGIASVSIDSGVATTDGSSTVYTLTIKYDDSTVADTTLTFTVDITLDPATGHAYVAYRTDTDITEYDWYDLSADYDDYANEAATCTTNEVLYVFCSVCGEFYEVVLDTTDEEEITASQITESDAGYELDLATGHTYVVLNAVLGTGDDAGYVIFTLTCSTDDCIASAIEVSVALDSEDLTVEGLGDDTCTNTESVKYTYTGYEYSDEALANDSSVTTLVYTIEGVELLEASHTYAKDSDGADIVDCYSVTINGTYYKYYYKQCTVCGALEIVEESTIYQATEVEITEGAGEDAGTFTTSINFVDDYTSYYGVEEDGLSMVTGTLTISTAGYYKVEVSTGATVTIYDENGTYYYNEKTEIDYIATYENNYINYFDAAATVAEDTVLYFVVYYYGDAYGDDAIVLTISLDSSYVAETAADYFEYTVDEDGFVYDDLDEDIDILVEVAGDYTIIITGEDADITIAYLNASTGNNYTLSTPDAVTVVTKAAEGDIITLGVYTAGNVVIIYEALTQNSTLGGTIADDDETEEDTTTGSITLTVVITEAGYYAVSYTGDGYAVIYDEDYNYYYGRNTEIAYVEDYNNVYADYYSAAAYIPAGTILYITLVGTENSAVSVTLTADDTYVAPVITDYVDYTLTSDVFSEELAEDGDGSIWTAAEYIVYVAEDGVYTIYVISGDVSVQYNDEYGSTTEAISGSLPLELSAGDIIVLEVYEDSTVIIVEGDVITEGEEATIALDEDNYSASYTLVITETGYYKVTTDGYVVINDGTYYYTPSITVDYIIDYNNFSEDAPISITAGTVLTVYVSGTEDITLLIELDEDYEAASGGSTSDYDFTLTSAGLEITFDNVTYSYSSYGTISYTVYVEEAGTYALTSNTYDGATLVTEDAYTVNLYSYDGDADSTYIEAGTVLYLYVYDADTITISAVTE